MADRYNSQRTLFKATYVPTKLPPQPTTADGQQPASAGVQQPPAPAPARVMAKVAFVRGLNIRPQEFSRLEAAQAATPADGRAMPPGPGDGAGPSLLESVKAVTTSLSPQLMNDYSRVLIEASAAALTSLGRDVSALRAEAAAAIEDLLRSIRGDYAAAKATVAELVTIPDAVAWAFQVGAPALVQLLDLVQPLTDDGAAPATPAQLLTQVRKLLQDSAASDSLIDSFVLSFSFEPVGRIHLERIEMTPVGVEHGELVYSVPLTPKETVNITHREWSNTTSTFENLVGDFFEGYSERGVTDKTDVATAVSNESKHSSSFDANGSVNFSYSGDPVSVTASAAVDYKTSNDDTASIRDSRTHSMAATRLASARTRNEHKQSFRVSAVTGVEDLAVRVLTNLSDTDAMRVDYFRLMRKWQVDLIRYGLRMTYDLVVPNPGDSLASKVYELRALSQAIAAPHSFDLAVDDITPDSWSALSQAYGATVDSPPQDPLYRMDGGELDTASGRDIDKWVDAIVSFDLPDGYVVTAGEFSADIHVGDGLYTGGRRPNLGVLFEGGSLANLNNDSLPNATRQNVAITVPLTSATVVGRTGHVSLLYSYYNVEWGGWVAKLQASPTPEAMTAWKQTVWNQLREADQANYRAAVQKMAERQAQLQEEINAYDSLTLRRMEREEIMRLVLVWLFGPKFQLVPALFEELGFISALAPAPDPAPEATLNPGQMTLSQWNAIREYGEFIKYLNNAIEWENVLYFTYPYFWDLMENWPFKRFLVHPDFDHRTFLRAGCARVIVPVRTGFERSFAQLVEHFTLPTSPGDAGALPADHPYVSIGDEMRHYAMTNYEHIPPANPDRNVRPLLYPPQQRAWADIQKWMQLLDQYNADHQPDPSATPPYDQNYYPATFNDLKSYARTKGTDISAISDDPWGRPYQYKSPGDYADYDLYTFGKHGAPAGASGLDPNVTSWADPLDQPITSWAEGNVVGRWNEYTPTGALDVAINLALPTKPEPA